MPSLEQELPWPALYNTPTIPFPTGLCRPLRKPTTRLTPPPFDDIIALTRRQHQHFPWRSRASVPQHLFIHEDRFLRSKERHFSGTHA